MKQNQYSQKHSEKFEKKKDNAWENMNKIWQELEPIILKVKQLDRNGYNNFCFHVQEYVDNPKFKGTHGVKNITTSKIRNIFSILKKMKAPEEVVRLRPSLAYLSGRDKKTKFFMNHLDKVIKNIETKEQLESFQQFFEAIICYAKEND